MKPDILQLAFFFYCLTTMLTSTACAQSSRPATSQPRLIGTCEGCEAVFEYGDRALSPVDTLPDFHEAGQKIKVSGTIYQADGQTPAAGVILYVYHTNQEGVYENRYRENNWGRRHGYIRGWIQTEADGRYAFYTLKPGTYPDGSEPAHIHPTILEPNGKYYWLGSYFFTGDPLLTENDRSDDRPRGGSSGIIELQPTEGLWVGQRDFILGRNVPGY